jgi:hypothetical protein
MLNKLNTTHTYLATTNYWVSLHKAEEDDHVEDVNKKGSAINCKHKLKQMGVLSRTTKKNEISN